MPGEELYSRTSPQISTLSESNTAHATLTPPVARRHDTQWHNVVATAWPHTR
jgi:hypothetical protein